MMLCAPHFLIDDDVLDAARALAATERRSGGAVLSSLARQALRPTMPREDADFPGFDVPADAPPITPAGDSIAPSYRDVTDVQLIAFARRHAGRLVSFDTKVARHLRDRLPPAGCAGRLMLHALTIASGEHDRSRLRDRFPPGQDAQRRDDAAFPEGPLVAAANHPQ